MFKSLIVAILIFVTTSANAAVVFIPSFFYYSRTQEQGGSESEYTQQIINLKLGSANGLYWGFAYDMESIDSGSNDQDRSSYGGSIGYMTGGWSFIGTYYLSSELEDYEGSGYAIDVGHIFGLGSINIGPLLSYRNFTYDELNGVAIQELNQTYLLPMIQFQATF